MDDRSVERTELSAGVATATPPHPPVARVRPRHQAWANPSGL